MGGTEGKMRGRKDVPPNNYFPKDKSDLKMIKVEENMEKCSTENTFRRIHYHVDPQTAD